MIGYITRKLLVPVATWLILVVVMTSYLALPAMVAVIVASAAVFGEIVLMIRLSPGRLIG